MGDQFRIPDVPETGAVIDPDGGINRVDRIADQCGAFGQGIRLHAVEEFSDVPGFRRSCLQLCYQLLPRQRGTVSGVEFRQMQGAEAAVPAGQQPEIVIDHQEIGLQFRQMPERRRQIFPEGAVERTADLHRLPVGAHQMLKGKWGRQWITVPHRRLRENPDFPREIRHRRPDRKETFSEFTHLVCRRNSLRHQREHERHVRQNSARIQAAHISGNRLLRIDKQRHDMDRTHCLSSLQTVLLFLCLRDAILYHARQRLSNNKEIIKINSAASAFPPEK